MKPPRCLYRLFQWLDKPVPEPFSEASRLCRQQADLPYISVLRRLGEFHGLEYRGISNELNDRFGTDLPAGHVVFDCQNPRLTAIPFFEIAGLQREFQGYQRRLADFKVQTAAVPGLRANEFPELGWLHSSHIPIADIEQEVDQKLSQFARAQADMGRFPNDFREENPLPRPPRLQDLCG